MAVLLCYGGGFRKGGPRLALAGRLGGRGPTSIASSLVSLGRLLCGSYCFRFDFGLYDVYIRFWAIHRGNQPYPSRSETRFSPRGTQLKIPLVQRRSSRFCPSVHIPTKNNLKLSSSSYFGCILSDFVLPVVFRAAPVEKRMFEQGISRRVGVFIARSARPTPSLLRVYTICDWLKKP